MSRQPEQVHIYLYRRNQSGEDEYAIFQRADNELWWQGVCGGVEAGETAERLIYFHDQKTALWEVKERLLRGNLVRQEA